MSNVFSMQVMDSLNNQKEHMKQSVKKWNSEKSANEEYIAQVKTRFKRTKEYKHIAQVKTMFKKKEKTIKNIAQVKTCFKRKKKQ